MGTRFSLGRGWTIGASGLRYGRSIPGVPRGYVSVGRSGTLLTGAHVRHWEPARRRRGQGPARPAAGGLGAPCLGTAASTGTTCRNPAPHGALTCAAHADQAPRIAAELRAALRGDWAGARWTPGPDDDLPVALSQAAARLRAAEGQHPTPGVPAGNPTLTSTRRPRWTPGAVYTVLLALLVVVGLIWAAYAQQAGFHRQDQAAGLAAARAAGAAGICLADDPDQIGNVAHVPHGTERGHYSWHLSDGTCGYGQREHFVAVGP